MGRQQIHVRSGARRSGANKAAAPAGDTSHRKKIALHAGRRDYALAIDLAIEHDDPVGVDIVGQYYTRWCSSFLFKAVRAGANRVIERVLELGYCHPNDAAKSLLFSALQQPHTLELLLRFGATVDATNDNGDTPLALAVKQDRMSAASVLLAHGAHITHKNHKRVSPLDLVMQRGSGKSLGHCQVTPEVSLLMLVSSADATPETLELITDAMVKKASSSSSSKKSAKGASKPYQSSMLAAALSSPYATLQTLEWLLSKPDVFDRTFVMPDGHTTLLHLAIRANKPVDFVRVLLDAQVPWRPSTLEPEHSLLFAACKHGSPAVISLLLDRGDRPWAAAIPDATVPSAANQPPTGDAAPAATTTATDDDDSDTPPNAAVALLCEEMVATLANRLHEQTQSMLETLEAFERAGLVFTRFLGSSARHRLLLEAVRHAQLEVVRFLLARKAPIELDEGDNETGYEQLLSSRQGSSAIRVAIELSYFSSAYFVVGRLPTYTFILTELVRESVRRGKVGCLNTLSTERGSLLYHAATKLRSKDLVTLLLRWGADPNLTGRLNADGEPCGMVATVLLETDSWDPIIETLLEHHSSPVTRDRRNMSPLHHVCHRKLNVTTPHGSALKMLIDLKADVNECWNANPLSSSSFSADTQGITPLMMVIMNYAGESEAMQMSKITTLIAANADVNLTGNADNWTPLLLTCNSAIYQRQERIARKLLSAGADINATLLSSGRSAWSYILHSSAAVPELLHTALHYSVSPNEPALVECGRREPPLMIALRHLGPTHAEYLVRARADVNCVSDLGESALSRALQHSSPFLERLLALGANPNLPRFGNGVRQPPILCLAVQHGGTQMTRIPLLLRYGADPNEADACTGQTPLHLMVEQQVYTSIDLLIQHGAVQRLNPLTHHTPLSLAISQRRRNHVPMLAQQPQFEMCSICTVAGELLVLEQCGHAFCAECLEGWVTTHASSPGPAITCPGTRCGEELSLSDVRRILPSNPQLVEQYDRRLMELCCNRIRTFAWCPKCPMGGIVPCSSTECPECGHTWCGYCHAESHPPGEECVIERDTIANFNYLSQFTRKCPGCRVATEHNGGCSHMRCYTCGQEWYE